MAEMNVELVAVEREVWSGKASFVFARTTVGEIGILRGVPRTATVRTTEPCTLWRISAADFEAALSTGSASASMLTLASARLARSHPRLAAAEEPTPALTPV